MLDASLVYIARDQLELHTENDSISKKNLGSDGAHL